LPVVGPLGPVDPLSSHGPPPASVEPVVLGPGLAVREPAPESILLGFVRSLGGGQVVVSNSGGLSSVSSSSGGSIVESLISSPEGIDIGTFLGCT